jgi:hypothetical protein
MSQRTLDMIDVIETIGLIDVDNEMHTGAAHAVTDHEVIIALIRARC